MTAPTGFSDDQRLHLELLSSVIGRMSGASSTIKSWTVPVVTAAYGFSLTGSQAEAAAWLGLMAVVLFGVLDTYYLDLERGYIRRFKQAVSGDLELFDMSPDRPDRGLFRFETLRSWAIWPFYGTLVGVGVLILVVLP
ncbi:hypothetical protein ACQBAT_13445 [Ornithinimicrobium sp. Y1847]|uniref:hypothetical protein n=1 Tax=Ornithinimicrobium sp. Y1847 TaxID=3405419 RepID=UPI003B681344